MSLRPLLASVLLLSLGLAAGYLLGTYGTPAAATQAKPTAPGLTMQDRLASNLFVQTSAEHRACCQQIYRLAGDRLEQLVKTPNPSAKPAVILDLDETMFDNSAFQNALYAANREYHQDLWDVYEKTDPAEVGLVAGAKEFLEKAGRLGVTPLFISNRLEKFRDSTVQALDRLGINTAGIADRMLLKGERKGPDDKTNYSDKSARREQFAARYNVLMLFGDNLRDFSEEFTAPKVAAPGGPAEYRAAAAERQKKADAAAARWGTDWFVLPNPVYGEWDKLAGPDPRAVLPRSKLDLTAVR